MRATTKLLTVLAMAAALTRMTPATAAVSDAAIADFAFSPNPVNVNVGDTVKWTNSDSAPHTVTADTGSFGSDNLDDGDTFSHTFGQAGTFDYHCDIHPGMKGTVRVGTQPTSTTTTTAAPTTTTTAPPTTVTTAPVTTATAPRTTVTTRATTTSTSPRSTTTAPRPTTTVTAAPTSTTVAPVSSTNPPTTEATPPPSETTMSTLVAAGVSDKAGGGGGNGGLLAAGAALLLLAGAGGWWALRRFRTA